jgi:glucosamine-6-phosphate deaminase
VKVNILKTPEELGTEAATFSAAILNEAIAKKGNARLILSTGAS